MKRLIQLHKGLIKYLLAEIPKKKTLKELIYFLRDTGKQYFHILLQEYKNLLRLLDPEFRKAKKEYDKQQNLRKDLQRCVKILKYIDERMTKSGLGRQERRAFWREFCSDGEVRSNLWKDIEKELKG